MHLFITASLLAGPRTEARLLSKPGNPGTHPLGNRAKTGVQACVQALSREILKIHEEGYREVAEEMSISFPGLQEGLQAASRHGLN